MRHLDVYLDDDFRVSRHNGTIVAVERLTEEEEEDSWEEHYSKRFSRLKWAQSSFTKDIICA